MCVCVGMEMYVHLCECPWSRGTCHISGIWVSGSCEPPHMGARKLGLLEESDALLTAEPPLQASTSHILSSHSTTKVQHQFMLSNLKTDLGKNKFALRN